MKEKGIRLLFLIGILFCIGCKAQENSIKDVLSEITYQEKGRNKGYLIRITADEWHIETKKKRAQGKMPSDVWQTLEKSLRSSVPYQWYTLHAPSNNRQRDGANAAFLTCTINQKIYQTIEFDAGNPPESLRFIITLIEALEKKEYDDNTRQTK